MEGMELSESTVASLLTSTLPSRVKDMANYKHSCELLATIEDFSLFSAIHIKLYATQTWSVKKQSKVCFCPSLLAQLKVSKKTMQEETRD